MSAAPARTARPESAATVFYDGGCPVCTREIGWYRRMAGAEALDWVDLSRADDAALPPGTDRAALLARFTVLRRDGRMVDGARGFAAMWQALGPTRRLGALASREPVLSLAEIGYRLFLRLRRLWR